MPALHGQQILLMLFLEDFNLDYTPFFQTLHSIEELALLLTLELKVLKHVSNGSARSSKPSNLISKVDDNQTFYASTLPSRVA